MLQLLLLLLPIAAISSWIAGYRHRKSMETDADSGEVSISPDYFLGLNYLINDEPDKAVDVFIKMLEVNTNTVETHLALGNLFRRRGEVDRAIRIHQNLIARPQLIPKYRTQALLELAQDYLRAGVMDRAERLFLELIECGGDVAVSLGSLISIYQQQKDWLQAIATAKKLENLTGAKVGNAIAHYYCELADQARINNIYEPAQAYLREALSHDKHCARANIILGKIFFAAGEYQQAIKTFLMVHEQDYVSEVINLLAESYKKLGKEAEFSSYLTERISENPKSYYVLAMVDYLMKKDPGSKGVDTASRYLAEQLPRCPSLRGLGKMLELYLSRVGEDVREPLIILRNFINKLLENKPVYRCIHCGFSCKNLYWQCPSCRRWNSVKPIHGLEGS